ncbi:MAG: histidine phosphatase family protein [Pseudomonadota bacterium]
MSGSFIFVRHGQTEWNRQKRFIGSADIPLNKAGLAQAKAVAERLADRASGVVISSPLSRAVQTADQICLRGDRKLTLDPRLTEIDLGKLQGRCEPELNFFSDWKSNTLRYAVEPFDKVMSRVSAAIFDAVQMSVDPPIIVAHSGVFFSICVWLDQPHLFTEIGHTIPVELSL